MMFVEFHDLNDNITMVNIGGVLFMKKSDAGTVLMFNTGVTCEVKESVEQITSAIQKMLFQMQIQGGGRGH